MKERGGSGVDGQGESGAGWDGPEETDDGAMRKAWFDQVTRDGYLTGEGRGAAAAAEEKAEEEAAAAAEEKAEEEGRERRCGDPEMGKAVDGKGRVGWVGW